MIQYIMFDRKPSFGSRNRVQTSFFWSKYDIQSVGVTLKIKSRSPKSNHFFSMSKWCFCASLVKIHQFVQEIECREGSFYRLYSVVTLIIRSMSPKSKQIFKQSQHYNMRSLARIRHLVQEIACRHAFFLGQNWKISQTL